MSDTVSKPHIVLGKSGWVCTHLGWCGIGKTPFAAFENLNFMTDCWLKNFAGTLLEAERA